MHTLQNCKGKKYLCIYRTEFRRIIRLIIK